MRRLLAGAVGHARVMGAAALEGFLVDAGGERIGQASGDVGTVALSEARGSGRVSPTAGRL